MVQRFGARNACGWTAKIASRHNSHGGTPQRLRSSLADGVRQGNRIQKVPDLDTPSRWDELDTNTRNKKRHKSLLLMAF